MQPPKTALGLVGVVLLLSASHGDIETAVRERIRRQTGHSRETIEKGKERWAIKTLADAGAARLKPKSIWKTTVNQLVHLPAERGKEQIRLATETKIVRVRARLVGISLEKDGDYHVAIADPDTGQTMIAEAVNPKYFSNRKWKSTIQQVRKAFDQQFHRSPNAKFSDPKFTELIGEATIEGVLFFDRAHGQIGKARNNLEIHPILRIRFSHARSASG